MTQADTFAELSDMIQEGGIELGRLRVAFQKSG
jgi:hypothetical protein